MLKACHTFTGGLFNAAMPGVRSEREQKIALLNTTEQVIKSSDIPLALAAYRFERGRVYPQLHVYPIGMMLILISLTST